MIEVVSIVFLCLIILALLVERHLTEKRHARETQKWQGAFLSRNIQDYLAVQKDDNKTTITQSEPENVELADLSEKDFDAYIASQN